MKNIALSALAWCVGLVVGSVVGLFGGIVLSGVYGLNWDHSRGAGVVIGGITTAQWFVALFWSDWSDITDMFDMREPKKPTPQTCPFLAVQEETKKVASALPIMP